MKNKKLDPIKTKGRKPEFAVNDIETMNWTKFIVLGHYEKNHYHEFRSLKHYFLFLASEQKTKTIFSHFGGKFDFNFLLREALRNETCKILNIIPRGSGLLSIDITIGSNNYTFRDSSALLPFSLKSLAENFDVTRKGEMDHSKTRGYTKALSEYLKADCIGLYQVLEKFYSWPMIEKAGGSFTMASQAMKVFQTYLKEPLYSPGKNTEEFLRKSYLGGRTEIFKPVHNKGKLFCYDVNSLYPFVLHNFDYPMGSCYWTFVPDKNRLGVWFAEVTSPRETNIPCLGILRDGKYLFPSGTFQGHWTSSELSYAKLQGYKIKYIEGLEWYSKKNIFKNFITDLYNIRKISPKNSVSDILAKLLMNSCYGRFGLNKSRTNIVVEPTLSKDPIFYKSVKVKNKLVPLFKQDVELETFTHLGIASFVTSYARIHMHKLMTPIQNKIYYTDTDSIFTTEKLSTSNDLGKLKLEGEYDSAVFLLPKTYIAQGAMDRKVAAKGFDKKKIQDFQLEDYHSALEGDLKKFKITTEPKFATIKSAIAQKKLVTMTKKSEKQLKAVYDKRIIFKLNGEYNTRPIQLNEGEK